MDLYEDLLEFCHFEVINSREILINKSFSIINSHKNIFSSAQNVTVIRFSTAKEIFKPKFNKSKPSN